MNRDTRYPVIPVPLFLRSQHAPPRSPAHDLAIAFLRLAKPASLGDRRSTVVARDEPRRQRLQHFRRSREVMLQRVYAIEPAFVVIEIGDMEAHLALASRGDLDQPAPQRQAVDGIAKHDAADEIED